MMILYNDIWRRWRNILMINNENDDSIIRKYMKREEKYMWRMKILIMKLLKKKMKMKKMIYDIWRMIYEERQPYIIWNMIMKKWNDNMKL